MFCFNFLNQVLPEGILVCPVTWGGKIKFARQSITNPIPQLRYSNDLNLILIDM